MSSLKYFTLAGLIVGILNLAAMAQGHKHYFVYINPLAASTRNPSVGLEYKHRMWNFNHLQLEVAYKIQDKRIGGFLLPGYQEEASILTTYRSLPRNRFPVYVYNGPSMSIGFLHCYKARSHIHYVCPSIVLKNYSYDSLHVEYNNIPKGTRDGIFGSSSFYRHTRIQDEKARTIGIGLEYGLRKNKENVMFNFFVRPNFLFTQRRVVSYGEEYGFYVNGKINTRSLDRNIYTRTLNTFQLGPEIGIRIGLTNFD